MKLIIVESPTKAKTISRFVGKNYTVKSSYGHIRDLPKSKLGVDTENDFAPEYTIPAKAKKNLSALQEIAAKSDKIILATDADREGEAISWHLAQALNLGNFGAGKKGKDYERIVFHEITKNAIEDALSNPRKIDMNLVDAQQARRILDRLVGYELSPLLWKKIRYGLSAGRVQSVAVRLIVEREEEINKFKAEEYWSVDALLRTVKKESLTGRLIKISGKTISKLDIKTKEEAEKIKRDLEKSNYRVLEIKKKETERHPLPPLTTSTLQQTASNLFGYSAKQTMMIAQQLYEGLDLGDAGSVGLITYMRTDSLNLSESSLASAQKYIRENLGKEYALAAPRRFKTKSKGAQEAHEAIRPTDPARSPESIKEFLDPKQFKLYSLIWQRMLASQMASAIIDSVSLDIAAENKEGTGYTLRANGFKIKFDGFLRIYPSAAGRRTEEIILPELEKDERLDLEKIINEQHFTEPPARYNEASLIKILEEYGIGRPSTYAPTISTIQERGYVEKIDKRFHPQEIGILVNKLLVEHFPQIVDIEFTAKMEENLDEIAENKKEWVPIIKDFYGPFKKNLSKKDKEINKKDLTEEKTDKKCPRCGSPMIIKLGRFGKFLACTNYPDCKTTEPLGEEKKLKETFANEKCALCGAPMAVKQGRFGAFLGCSKYPECKNIKKIEKTIGMKCPKCLASPDLAKRDNPGEIVEKKGKFKKAFYGCNRYPDCDFTSSKNPMPEPEDKN